jgi:hypothetical protein
MKELLQLVLLIIVTIAAALTGTEIGIVMLTEIVIVIETVTGKETGIASGLLIVEVIIDQSAKRIAADCHSRQWKRFREQWMPFPTHCRFPVCHEAGGTLLPDSIRVKVLPALCCGISQQ